MVEQERFETLILGSGQGGKLLAWQFGRLGQRVAVVERRWVGGSCPAVACLPSKNEIWSARVAHLAQNASQFGTVTGPVETAMAKVRSRKQGMIEREIAFHLNAYKTSGAELIMGSGRFVAPKTIEVTLNDGGTRLLTGDRVVINVGSHAAIPTIPGIEAARPLTHIEALELEYTPAHLIVLGGGYSGVEMAQAYRRFGSRVTIIEPGPRPMSREDPDVAGELQRILTAEGIRILTGAEPIRVQGRSGAQVSVAVRSASGEQQIDGTDLLVAVGRIPNTTDIGLDKAGVELDSRGFIRVNDRLQTSAPDVWAIGECAGSPQFTHVGEDDCRVVLDNLAGGSRTTRGRLIPYCLFTDPEVAHVGMSESEARAKKVPYRIARMPMALVLRTHTLSEKRGFIKALIGSDDRLLGFTVFGAEASELMAVAQTAMIGGIPYTVLRDTIWTHPTAAEGLLGLFANPPATPAPEPPVSSHSFNAGRPGRTIPATAKE